MGQLTDGTLYTLGLERADYLAVIVGCLIVGVIGSMKERGISVQKKMGELAVPVRWGLYYALVIGIFDLRSVWGWISDSGSDLCWFLR